ncbi:MAG: hypothetical protein FVQ83_03385 [Chloroflexi bacterium]|nr:hypothetical protein [Chloroflexota bacterium]
MLAKMITTRTIQNKLGSISRQNSVSKAVLNSYKTFAKQNPQWEASLFDEYFINTKVVPMVEAAINNGEFVRAKDIANQWANQFFLRSSSRREAVIELQPVVNTFLQEINQELMN